MTRIQNESGYTTARVDARIITERGVKFSKKKVKPSAKAPIRYGRDHFNKKEP